MTPTDKAREAAYAYATLIAMPVLRSMWPSMSRGELADMLADAHLAGHRAGVFEGMERSRKAVSAERLHDMDLNCATDRAYQQAIRDCEQAIKKLKGTVGNEG